MNKPLLIILLLLNLQIFAQQGLPTVIIKGTVIDSNKNVPLGFATIFVTDAQTSQVVKSTLAKDDGTFTITVPANRAYALTVAFVGYQPNTVKMPLVNGKIQPDLGKITLSVLSGQLKGISVTAFKPLMKQEIDRLSYNVQADPESKASDALEMLRKMPMVTIAGNGIIQLKGSTSFRIFINGKPSALMVNSPADVLKAMPAATILRIEVITVPPSKYDGEGLAGIINIVTLERSEDGVNGTFFTRVNNIVGERGSISLNAKEGKFGFTSIFGIGHEFLHTTAASSQLITFAPATNLLQQGNNTNGGNLNNGQAQLSYEVDSLHLIATSVDFNNRNFVRDNFHYSHFYVLPDSLAQSYQLTNTGKNDFGALDASLSYQMGFKHHKNQLLTLLYQYASTSNNQTNAVNIANGYNYANSSYDQQNNAGTKEQTFQLDFTKPINIVTMEAGAKAIFRNNNSDFEDENLDLASAQFIPDAALTNQFNYHQDVYSLYNTYQVKLGGWNFKGGLRAEHTAISGDFSSGSAFTGQHYLNLLPALAVQRTYQQAGTFTFGFTERIERPGIAQLNPFVDRSNPDFIVTGNPELRPVLNHILELGYRKFAKASFNATLNYAFANNTIQSITSLISDTLSKTTYSNIGRNRMAGVNLGANLPVTNNLNFSLNAQISRLWLTGVYDDLLYKNQGNQGNIGVFARYTFNSDFNATVNYGYQSGTIFLQGKSSDYFFTSMVFIKDILHKRSTISLTIYDPFQKFNTYSSYTKTPDFQQYTYAQNYYQNFRLAVNYKFGKMKGTVKTGRSSVKNDDVKQTNSENE